MKITVEVEFEIEDGCTNDDIEEWVKFELGYTSSMNLSNKLNGKDFEPTCIRLKRVK